MEELSTSGSRRSEHFVRPGRSVSSAPTSVQRATPISSFRTGGTAHGPDGREPLPLSPDEVRSRYSRLREDVGPSVTVVAATKYVAPADMAALVEAGVEVVGENRAQDLEAKYALYGDAFRWHFIGHLQSRKALAVSRICELVHSLDSDSAAKRLTIPSLVQVNLSGEATKSGVAPEELDRLLELGIEIRGLSTMPPLTGDPEASRPYFRRLRELAELHSLTELSMGTTQDYRVAVEEGATLIRVGSALWQG